MTLPPRGTPPTGSGPGRPRPAPRYVEPSYLGQQYPVLPPGMLAQSRPEAEPVPAVRSAAPEPRGRGDRRPLPDGTIGVIALVVIAVLAIGGFFFLRGAANRGASAAPERTITAAAPDGDRTVVAELFEDWVSDMDGKRWVAALARLCPEAASVRREVEELRREVERGSEISMGVAVHQVTITGDRAVVLMDLTTQGRSVGTRAGSARRDGDAWCILS